jgi:hypothetical protein
VILLPFILRLLNMCASGLRLACAHVGMPGMAFEEPAELSLLPFEACMALIGLLHSSLQSTPRAGWPSCPFAPFKSKNISLPSQTQQPGGKHECADNEESPESLVIPSVRFHAEWLAGIHWRIWRPLRTGAAMCWWARLGG